jgi:hypothetical protein
LKGKGVHFEHAWQYGHPTTCHQPIIFPPHLQKINDMAIWVKEAICDHLLMKILSKPFDFAKLHNIDL